MHNDDNVNSTVQEYESLISLNYNNIMNKKWIPSNSQGDQN